MALAAVIVASIFLFTNLGHYALWDDEANTALIGEGVWRTGDTSAVVGHNLVAFRSGAELSQLKARYLPPLQYYVAAPFVGLWPGNALAARLPFAAAGLLSVVVIFWWLFQVHASRLTFVLAAMAMLGNVSLWLYLRQCRYYSLSVFFSLGVAYLYFTATRKWWTHPLIALFSIGLLASNYIGFAALYGVLAVDWFFWGRHRRALERRDLLWLIVPQLLIGGCILYIWDPLTKHVVPGAPLQWSDRLRLFWWAWRDLNLCEFGSLSLLMVGPIVGWWRREPLLIRSSLALLGYVIIVVILTPQNPSAPIDVRMLQPRIFDVRYLVPAIPLMIAIQTLTVARLFKGTSWSPALIFAAVAFGTNLLEGGSLAGNDLFGASTPIVRSSVLLFANELVDPPPDPYALTAKWINEHVARDQSIWVLPEFMTYPLMFHAPQAIYAWQLSRNAPADLQGLNPVFYRGKIVPDYVVCFGPEGTSIAAASRFPSPVSAEQVATIDFFWHDVFRPELAWRSFSRITGYRREADAIRIFRLRSRAK